MRRLLSRTAGRPALVRITGAALALLVASLSNVVHATAFDLRSDWSDSSNPNGPWTYRVGTSALPSVANWTPLGSSTTQPAWAPGTTPGNFLPAWFRAVEDPVSTFDWDTGDVIVHTTDRANGAPGGVESDPANVIWTSPFIGIASIFGGLWDGRQSTPARPQRWDLFVDGSLVDSGNLPGTAADGISRSTPDSFSLTNVLLDAGDIVELRITRTDLSNSGSGDFVGVNLSVDLQPRAPSAAPEPTTLALLALGMAGLAYARQRTRR